MDLGVIGFCQTIYRVHKGQDNWLHVHSFEMLYISDSADSDLCAVHLWHQYENVKAFLLYFQSTLTKLRLWKENALLSCLWWLNKQERVALKKGKMTSFSPYKPYAGMLRWSGENPIHTWLKHSTVQATMGAFLSFMRHRAYEVSKVQEAHDFLFENL